MELEDVLFWFVPAALAIVGFFGWRLSSRIRRVWLRRSLRTVPITVWTFAIAMALVGFAFRSFDRGLYSDQTFLAPDGKHLARLRFVTPGALGSDMILVQVRVNWFHAWIDVYKANGTKDDGQEPELRWLDSKRLLVSYPAVMVSTDTGLRRYEEDRCQQGVAGVSIVCEAR